MKSSVHLFQEGLLHLLLMAGKTAKDIPCERSLHIRKLFLGLGWEELFLVSHANPLFSTNSRGFLKGRQVPFMMNQSLGL